MDKRKVIYSVLKEVEKGNYPNHTDYDLTKEEFGIVVEMMIDKELIENANVIRAGRDNKVLMVMLNHSRIGFNGMEYLEENNPLAKTYKGLKEIREWIKL